MVNEIRLYVEGGGQDRDAKARLGAGFNGFLTDLRTLARSRRIKWQIIPCGSRDEAYRKFVKALKTHPDAFNVLLVDSEGPVRGKPWEHLQHREGWRSYGVDDAQCHLMVQMMEAWFIADINALEGFYGQGFNANAIPRNTNVEKVSKQRIESALKAATQRTTKGEYHKTHHGPKLLEQLDVSKVRKAASHCDLLFTILEEKMT